MDDWNLLRQYVDGGSRAAMDELARRHLAMVYAAARREVDDPHLAEDITQAVFLVLIRKAPHLSEKVVLAGWLFNVVRYVASGARRARSRRVYHEREAADMQSQQTDETDPLEIQELLPRLNDAIARLPAADRDAVVMRFLEGKSNRDVAAAQRISESAVRQRLFRAMRKLRSRLGSAGVTPTESATTAALMSAVAEPPTGLASSVGALISNVGAQTPAHALANSAIRSMFMFKSKVVAAIVAVGILGTVGGGFLAHALAQQISGSGATTQPALAQRAAAAPVANQKMIVIDGELTRLEKTLLAILPVDSGGVARNFTLDDQTTFGFTGVTERKNAAGGTVRSYQNINAAFDDLKVGQRVIVVPGEPATRAKFVGIVRDFKAATQPVAASVAPDLSTPDKSLESLCQALQAADRNGVYACLTADPNRPKSPMDASLDEGLASRRMILAGEKIYGPAADSLLNGELPLETVLQAVVTLRQLRGDAATINGNDATINVEIPATLLQSMPAGIQGILRAWSGKPIHFVLRDGGWRIDAERSLQYVMEIQPQKNARQAPASAAVTIAVLEQEAVDWDAVAEKISQHALPKLADGQRAVQAKIRQTHAKFGIYSLSTYVVPAEANRP